MPWRRMIPAIAAAAIVAATLTPNNASARHRVRGHVWADRGWSAVDFCGGQLPAYGADACGNREFSYGPGSCYRRAVTYTRQGPVARRVYVCG